MSNNHTQLKSGWTYESVTDMNTTGGYRAPVALTTGTANTAIGFDAAQASVRIGLGSNPIAADKDLLQRTILDWRLNHLKKNSSGLEAEKLSTSTPSFMKREKKEFSWDQVVIGCRVITSNESGIVVRKATYHCVENFVDEAGVLAADFQQTTEQYRFAWIATEGRFENWRLVELSEIYEVEAMSLEMLLTHENFAIRAFGRTLLNKSGEEVMQQWIDSGRYNNQDGEQLFDTDLLMTFRAESTQHNIDLAKSIGRTPDKKRLLEIFIKLQNAYNNYVK